MSEGKPGCILHVVQCRRDVMSMARNARRLSVRALRNKDARLRQSSIQEDTELQKLPVAYDGTVSYANLPGFPSEILQSFESNSGMENLDMTPCLAILISPYLWKGL